MDQHEQQASEYEAPAVEDLDTTQAPSSVAAAVITQLT